MEYVSSFISGAFGLVFFIIEAILVIYAVLDIIKNRNFNMNTKLLWVIIIILIPILGSILYLVWGRNKNFVD